MNTQELLEVINYDVPQLMVKPDTMSSSVYKEGVGILNDSFLWSYQREKYSEFSVRHHVINGFLREVYLNHKTHLDARQKEDYYPVDRFHYEELYMVKNICIGLYWLTVEQLTIIDFMNYLNIHKEYPPTFILNGRLKQLMSKKFLQDSLSSFQSFIHDLDLIDSSFQNFFIHPHTDELLIDDEPTIIIFNQNTFSHSKKLLSELVKSYNNFFAHCKYVLQTCSPEALRLMAEKI